MSNIRFLVVEDEPDSAAVVEMTLNPAHVATEVVTNAEDALLVLERQSDDFDGVIIDLALPGMDGLELLTAIRSYSAYDHLKLIAITAFHSPELKSRATRAGFDAYFPKPLNTAVFLGTLENLLQ